MFLSFLLHSVVAQETNQDSLAGYGQDISDSARGIPHAIRLDEHRVLKKARNVLDPEIMKFITANTTIPVPKTYEIKFDKEQDTFYIVMDYMHGEPLDRVWSNLNQDQRASTCRQIAGYLDELRQLTGTQIEGVNGAPVGVGCYYSRWGGPFQSEKDFNHFMAPNAQQYPSR